jgi:hypothetical protein
MCIMRMSGGEIGCGDFVFKMKMHKMSQRPAHERLCIVHQPSNSASFGERINSAAEDVLADSPTLLDERDGGGTPN